MNSTFFKKLFGPKLLLIVIFFALLGYEAYIVYYKVYSSLGTEVVTNAAVENNVVRLDIKSYSKMIDLLDARANYKAPSLTVNNPFK